jgi:hypothetical protein
LDGLQPERCRTREVHGGYPDPEIGFDKINFKVVFIAFDP